MNPSRGVPSPSVALAPGKPAAARWWQARTVREQRLLMAGAVVVLAFAVWKLALAPALSTMSTAHERLSALRTDAALAGAIALDAQALRSRVPVVRESGSSLQEQLRGWLQRHGLDSTIRIVNIGDDRTEQLHLHIDNAEAAGLIQWLATLPEVFPVTVVDATLARTVIDGRDQAGRISGTLVLQPRSEGVSP